MDTALWSPTTEQIESSVIRKFQRFLEAESGVTFDDYLSLQRWSVEHTETFWSVFWDWAQITCDCKGERILLAGKQMLGAQWFPDARLNFAENLLQRRDNKPALIFRCEDGRRQVISYQQLYQRTAKLAAGIKARGVESGDRVVGYMPNCIDTVVAMLATTSLGAVWSSCSQDFGIQGVLDRFGQIKPKLLFSTDGYIYGGKRHPRLRQVAKISEQLTTLEHVVIIPFIEESPDLGELPHACLLCEVEGSGVDSVGGTELKFNRLPFNHPLYIMYSSGTTGVPKCIVHGAGGTLIQHLKEHRLHTNLSDADVFFYYTTCGWMMWNWLVSGLATGASIVLYDGSPFYPSAEVLMKMAEEEKISVFGTSAKYISALEKSGVKPVLTHDLGSLRALLSTGSPLAHESFDYVYRDIKKDLQLASISGGTDIISCFALGCPTSPVYRGELQCAGLGMAVAIVDDQGLSIVGEKGELVCTKPFPSMPIYFWDDPGGEKFCRAYFQRFEGIWAHGDYGEITVHEYHQQKYEQSRGLIIHGRSDAVLNPGGVRIGTAEIYRQVEQIDEVLESICVGQSWRDDERVILFVRLREGVALTEALARRVRDQIRQHTTPRHVPDKIVQVADIPRTVSGKIVELAVKRVIEGKDVNNKEALANPQALALYKDLPQLQSD